MFTCYAGPPVAIDTASHPAVWRIERKEEGDRRGIARQC
jgi:hypothetical protein